MEFSSDVTKINTVQNLFPQIFEQEDKKNSQPLSPKELMNIIRGEDFPGKVVDGVSLLSVVVGFVVAGIAISVGAVTGGIASVVITAVALAALQMYQHKTKDSREERVTDAAMNLLKQASLHELKELGVDLNLLNRCVKAKKLDPEVSVYIQGLQAEYSGYLKLKRDVNRVLFNFALKNAPANEPRMKLDPDMDSSYTAVIQHDLDTVEQYWRTYRDSL